MLGDGKAAGGRHERGAGRDVDQARPISPGAAAIGEQVVGPLERFGSGGQRAGRADHFLGGFALHPERDEHPGDFGGFEPAEHEPLEQMLGIFARQILARQKLGQGIGNRAVIGRQMMESGRVGQLRGKLLHWGILAWANKKPAGKAGFERVGWWSSSGSPAAPSRRRKEGRTPPAQGLGGIRKVGALVHGA